MATPEERREYLRQALKDSGMLEDNIPAALRTFGDVVARAFEDEIIIDDSGYCSPVIAWMQGHDRFKDFWPADKLPSHPAYEPPPEPPKPQHVDMTGPDIIVDKGMLRNPGLPYYQRVKEQAKSNNSKLIIQNDPDEHVQPGLATDDSGSPVYNVSKSVMTGNVQQYERIKAEAAKHGARVQFFDD